MQLKGPTDDGNFVWTDATQDRLGKFGIGFSDFGAPISWSGNLKADILDDQYGPSSPISPKVLVSMWFDLSIPQQTNGATISMIGNVTTDYETTTSQAAQTVSVVVGGAAYYGSAHYGQDHYTSARTQMFQYATPRRTGLQADSGRTIQLGWSESSANPVTILGITGEYDFKNVQGSP